MPPGAAGGYPGGYYNPYAANPYAHWQAGAGGPPPPHMYNHPSMRGGVGPGGVYYPPPPMAPGQASPAGLMATPPPGTPSSGGAGSAATAVTSAGASYSPATNAVPSTPFVQAPKPRRPLVITVRFLVVDLVSGKICPDIAFCSHFTSCFFANAG